MRSVSIRLKVLSCVLAGVLCFGGVIGCSGSGSGDEPLADTGAVEQADETAKAIEAAKQAEEEALAQAEADRKAAEEAAAKAEADRKAAEEAAAQAEAERKAAEEAKAEEERKAAEEAAAKAEAEEKARQESEAAAAAAQAEEQASSSSESSYTVYITKTGEKYHSGGCRYLKKSKIAIDINDARAQGYDPCSVCNP